MTSQPDSTALHQVWADLHLHTVVSPCAEIEMIPPLIVRRAQALGLGLIAVTDHNTVDNVEAVQHAARGTGLSVLPGMEVQTREEVHLVCLFDRLDQAYAWQEVVYASLPDAPNRPEVFGAQFVVDSTGDYVRDNQRLLLTSTRMSLEQAVAEVNGLGGLAIAAHVDRPSYSVLANLGFIPEGLALAGLELSQRTEPDAFRKQYPALAEWPLLRSGDAHRLSEMCAATLFRIGAPTCAELSMALRRADGRCIETLGATPYRSIPS